MSSSMPPEVHEAANVVAITQLILRERESRDLGRWETMGSCFWPESQVRVSWFRGSGADFVEGSVDMARRGILAKHRLAPILVRCPGDRAVASLTAIIDLPVRLQGVELILSAHARFLYRTERRKGRWGIMGFDAIYIRDELTAAIPGQTISIDPKDVSGCRPTYRMLSYYLKTQGYDIDPNLAGEDRPDLTAALNREIFDWAGLSD